MKRFATFLLALVMIMSLAIPAFAAGEEPETPVKNDSITINNAKPGETYAIYKMFDLKVNNEITPTAYTYTVISAWADFFKAPVEADGDTPEEKAGPGYQYVTINEAGEVTAISDAAALAKAAANWTSKPAATDSKTVAENDTSVAFTGLEDGYWLITSTLGTKAMAYTTPDNEAVVINDKNPENTIQKFVKEDSTNEWGETNDAQVGDIVEFKSVVKIVKGTRNVVVHDKMYTEEPNGSVKENKNCFHFAADSVKIEGLTEGTHYTVDANPSDGDTFDIVFNQEWIDSLDFGDDGFKEYVITYSAQLTSYPVAMNLPKDSYNRTYVSFGNASESERDITVTKTHYFSVNKHAAGSDTHLAGAVFKLMKGEEVVKLVKFGPPNAYRVERDKGGTTLETFITVDESTEHLAYGSADIFILGVDSDSDYTLVEVTAPEGYNKLKDPIEVTVNADNSTRVDVANQSGTELPSTGGVGTTMFYIFGGILVLAAVVLLVTKKRMAVAE